MGGGAFEEIELSDDEEDGGEMAVALRERSEEGRGESESNPRSSLSRLPRNQARVSISRAARSPPQSPESVPELGSPCFEFGWRAREASTEESGRDVTDLSIKIAPGRKHDV